MVESVVSSNEKSPLIHPPISRKKTNGLRLFGRLVSYRVSLKQFVTGNLEIGIEQLDCQSAVRSSQLCSLSSGVLKFCNCECHCLSIMFVNWLIFCCGVHSATPIGQ